MLAQGRPCAGHSRLGHVFLTCSAFVTKDVYLKDKFSHLTFSKDREQQ